MPRKFLNRIQDRNKLCIKGMCMKKNNRHTTLGIHVCQAKALSRVSASNNCNRSSTALYHARNGDRLHPKIFEIEKESPVFDQPLSEHLPNQRCTNVSDVCIDEQVLLLQCFGQTATWGIRVSFRFLKNVSVLLRYQRQKTLDIILFGFRLIMFSYRRKQHLPCFLVVPTVYPVLGTRVMYKSRFAFA